MGSSIARCFLLFLISCTTAPVSVVKQHLVAKKENLKICFVGDTGKVTEELHKTISAMYKSECSHIVVLGDLIYGKGWPLKKGLRSADDKQFEDMFLVPWKKLTSSNRLIMPVIGNHDSYGKEESWFELSKRYEWLYIPDRNWFYSIGGICLAGYDPKKKDEAEMFFESIDWSHCIYRIALNHYPYKTKKIGGHSDASGSTKKIKERYVLNKVNAHFAGHIHKLAYIGLIEETHFFISGSGAKKDDLNEDHKAPFAASEYGYILATFGEDNVVYEFKDFKNKTLYTVRDEL